MNDKLIDPETWLREQDARIEALKAEAEQAGAALAAARVTRVSQDMSVTVTVNPSGGLEDLLLTARATQLGPTRLAAVVLDTYAKACADAARSTLEIMSGLVGNNSEAMEFLRSTLPATDTDGSGDTNAAGARLEGW